jgi:hypothetical protein
VQSRHLSLHCHPLFTNPSTHPSYAVQCFGSGSASASNKNLDPDPHQINIRNRIRIRLRVKVISRIRIRFSIRIRIEVMRIRNTIQWSTVQFSCLNLGMSEELRRTRLYVHLKKIKNIFTPREKALFRLDLNHVILHILQDPTGLYSGDEDMAILNICFPVC